MVPQIAALVEHRLAAWVLALEEQLDSTFVVAAYLVNLMPFFRNALKMLNIGTRLNIWNNLLSLQKLVFFFWFFDRLLVFHVFLTDVGPLLAHRLGFELLDISFWLELSSKVCQAIQECLGLVKLLLFSAFLKFYLLLGNHWSRLRMYPFVWRHLVRYNKRRVLRQELSRKSAHIGNTGNTDFRLARSHRQVQRVTLELLNSLWWQRLELIITPQKAGDTARQICLNLLLDHDVDDIAPECRLSTLFASSKASIAYWH